MKFIFLFSILTSSCINVNATTVARMYFELSNYTNPFGRLANGKGCDPSTRCDPFFEICVSSSERRTDCLYFNDTSRVFTDTNDVYGTISDIRIEIKSLISSSFYISITVRDYDEGRLNYQEPVATFIFDGKVEPLSDRLLPQQRSSLPLKRRDTPSFNPDVKINVGFDLFCGPNRFGDLCQVMCISQIKYHCGLDGMKICRPGFVGKDCEMENLCINETTCAEGAKCVMRSHGEIVCECDNRDHTCYRNAQYTSCLNNPCQNGGECTADKYHFNCKCKEPFQGPHCEVKRGFCESNPCLNDGKCIDRESDYQCYCMDPFKGQHCEIRSKRPCDSNPCKNDGQCIEIIWVNRTLFFQCKCNDSFTGEFCSSPVPVKDFFDLSMNNIIIGSVLCGVLLLILLTSMIVCITRRRKNCSGIHSIKEITQQDVRNLNSLEIDEGEYLAPVVTIQPGDGLSLSRENHSMDSDHYEIPELDDDAYEALCYQDPQSIPATESSHYECELKAFQPSLPPRLAPRIKK